MTSHDNTWILVADASRARLFHPPEKEGQPLTLVQHFDHPGSRAKVHDLVSDHEGRTQQSGPSGGGSGTGTGKGSRSGMEPHTDPKMVEAEHFAHDLAKVLEKHMSGHTARLVLVAPPHFLGVLREVIGEQVRKRVVASLDKDYTHFDVRELSERLASVLPAE